MLLLGFSSSTGCQDYQTYRKNEQIKRVLAYWQYLEKKTPKDMPAEVRYEVIRRNLCSTVKEAYQLAAPYFAEQCVQQWEQESTREREKERIKALVE